MSHTTRALPPQRPLPWAAFFAGLAALSCAPQQPGYERQIADPFGAAAVLREAIAEHAFPGCAVAVGTQNGLLWLEAFGHLHYTSSEPVTLHTRYDLASLTKVCSTTLVALRLVAEGIVALEDPVSRHLPRFREDGREEITIEHLLTHSSGLPAWRPLYREAKSYDELIALALDVPPDEKPGLLMRYSDIGIILLGQALALAAGSPLEKLEQELVFRPLGMAHTKRQLSRSERFSTAPTEKLESGEVMHGVVHDENARAGEGLTAHAGLFSTAPDLARLAAELLRAWHGNSELFPQELLQQFTSRRNLPAGSSRALGWDTPSGRSSSGQYFGPRSFGHTGFTGTSLWIDPERQLYVLLLTNRVHPTRRNRKIGAVRRALADRVIEALEGVSADPAKTH